MAKIPQVPAIIRELTDAECYEIALIENIQRSDLSVIEESQGYQKLLETNRCTQDQLSDIIGKSRSHIANLLRLLLLPPSVQSLLLDRKITMGQARPLIGHDQAEALAKMIVAKALSARQVEALAKQPAGQPVQKPKPLEKSADIKALEKQAAEKLGLAFHIDWNETKDRGKVTIDCQSLDQMTNLLAQLGIRYDLIPISIASKRTREMVLSSYYLFLPLEEWQTPDSLHSSRHSYFNTYSNPTIAQRVTNLHCPQRRIFPSLTQLSHLLKRMRMLCVLSIS